MTDALVLTITVTKENTNLVNAYLTNAEQLQTNWHFYCTTIPLSGGKSRLNISAHMANVELTKNLQYE